MKILDASTVARDNQSLETKEPGIVNQELFMISLKAQDSVQISRMKSPTQEIYGHDNSGQTLA